MKRKNRNLEGDSVVVTCLGCEGEGNDPLHPKNVCPYCLGEKTVSLEKAEEIGQEMEEKELILNIFFDSSYY